MVRYSAYRKRKAGFARSRAKLRRGYPGKGKRRRFARRKVYGQELKFFDTLIAIGGIPTAGAVHPTFNNVAEGTARSERVGRKIVIRRIGWKYSNLATPTPPVESTVVRLIVFLDTQANGATATVAEILDTAQYHSFRKLENAQRFSILMDRTHPCNVLAKTTATGIDFDYGFDFYSKELNIPIEFDNSFIDGRLETIRSNNIGLLLISKSNNDVDVNGTMRIRYTDS